MPNDKKYNLKWLHPASSKPDKDFERHQFFLILEIEKFKELGKSGMVKLLNHHFSGIEEYLEFVQINENFICFRAWIDLKFGDSTNFLDEEEKE